MKCVIIGAGFGGLSAACYLAKAGHDVEIYEKNDQPGGRAFTFSQDGFRFEAGPSWYLMPDVFDEFFANFNHKTSDFYELKKLVPAYRVFDSSEQIDVRPYPAVLADFERRDPGSAVRLEKYLSKVAREYNLVREGVLELDGDWSSYAKSRQALAMLANPKLVMPISQRIASVTKDNLLQKILEFMVVFLGGSPSNIPAFYGLLNYVDMGLGVYYPEGGFRAVAKSFETVASDLGVKIHYNSPVDQIQSSNGRATGVVVMGREVNADIVVANADYAYIENTMLPSRSRDWKNQQLAPSAIMAFIGVRGKVDGLLHHSLFFDAGWKESFDAIYKSKSLPDRPLFYVSTMSKSDDSVSPEGCENIFILVPVPAGLKIDDSKANNIIDGILDRIANRTGCSDLVSRIITRRVTTPDYFTSTFNATDGNAFGLAHTLLQSGPMRPSVRSRVLDNLYHVGQFTNPGTGVPLVVIGGKVTAEAVIKDSAHEKP